MRGILVFWLLLAPLAACAPPGMPVATAHHRIVTDGYFALPGDVRLPYRQWLPEQQPKAVVVALHGFTDSRDGYDMLGSYLAKHGVAVIAFDQSGFGATPDRGFWAGTDVMLDQARAVIGEVRARYPRTRLVVMGESMGGAEALLLGASRDPPPVDAYVLSAPAVWGGPTLDPVYQVALRFGDLAIPWARFTGKQAHILASDNIAALIAFGEDPLTIIGPRVDMVAGLVRMMGAAQAACARFAPPHALVLYGGHDELIPKEAMRACWRAMPPTPGVVKAFYPPDYHLIERDHERAVPDADILGFILHPDRPLASAAEADAIAFMAEDGDT